MEKSRNKQCFIFTYFSFHLLICYCKLIGQGTHSGFLQLALCTLSLKQTRANFTDFQLNRISNELTNNKKVGYTFA